MLRLTMESPQPVEVAKGLFGGPGFAVSRNGENVEVRIPSPRRGPVILLNWLWNLLIVGGCVYAIAALAPLWESREDGVDVCSMIGTLFLAVILVWSSVGALRRIARAHRRRLQTLIGVTDGILWCEPADAPPARFRWPVNEVSRLRARRRRFSRRVFWLEVRSRHRALIRLRISGRKRIAVEPVDHILQHAMREVLAASHSPEEPQDMQSKTLAYAPMPSSPAPAAKSNDPIVRYFGGEAAIEWVTVASYERFSDFHTAHSALWVIDIPGRLGSPPDHKPPGYQLLVPKGHAEAARRIVVRPQEWLDQSHCPRCGCPGMRLSFPGRIAQLQASDVTDHVQPRVAFVRDVRPAVLGNEFGWEHDR